MTIRQQTPHRPMKNRHHASREGYILVWFALSLTVLLGMAGLVIDSGLLMSAHRQAQNAADSGATAAAMHLLRGQTLADATTVATTFVNTHNGLGNAGVTVNSPPQSGPYASGGTGTYVEVLVSHNVTTFLVHFLPNVNQVQTVQARAVAGYEAVSAGEGVMVLDPTARPGLDVSGQGAIRVDGRVVVNSEGGGVDENGVPVNNGNNGVAASAGQNNSVNGIYAKVIDVVGGVDNPHLFKPYVAGDPPPLKAKQPPEPDPLINLPIPTTALGVDSTIRGTVTVNQTNVNGLGTDTAGQNFQAVGGEIVGDGHTAAAGEVILHPGIYHRIDINDGAVYFIPGIYVLSSQFANQNVLHVTGGNVIFDKSMFYITGDNYDPVSGWPDTTDGSNPPPHTDGAKLGRVSINADADMTPIDTTAVNYSAMYAGAPAVSNQFDAMLFFQRRRSTQRVTITGNAANGVLAGTLYGKWANFQISGQGTYDAQFIVGSMSATGQADITILGAGGGRGKANQVFLVE